MFPSSVTDPARTRTGCSHSSLVAVLSIAESSG
jgi:hypothetical protein